MSDMFPLLQPSDVTLEMKIKELRREIGVRKRVYKRWSEQGKLDPALGRARIVMLQAILNDYEREANGEQVRQQENRR